MQKLKISVFKSSAASGKSPAEAGKAEKEIVLPLSTLHVGIRFLPQKIKMYLDREGIDINAGRDLTKEKGLKGTLIEIENRDECIVISLE